MSDTQNTTTGKAPWHFWVIGIGGLLWNCMGALDYVMTQTKNDSYMSAYSPEQLSFFYGLPSWAVAAWAVAVWGGVIGAVFLLMRKAVAVQVFLVSLIAMVLTSFQNYVLSNGMEIMGDPFSLVFTLIIFLITIGLYLYAKAMRDKGLLT